MVKLSRRGFLGLAGGAAAAVIAAPAVEQIQQVAAFIPAERLDYVPRQIIKPEPGIWLAEWWENPQSITINKHAYTAVKWEEIPPFYDEDGREAYLYEVHGIDEHGRAYMEQRVEYRRQNGEVVGVEEGRVYAKPIKGYVTAMETERESLFIQGWDRPDLRPEPFLGLTDEDYRRAWKKLAEADMFNPNSRAHREILSKAIETGFIS